MVTSFAVVPGYWNVTVYGRKHCYRLYTKLLNEATRWSSAIQNVIDTKAPIDTPTQQLIQDIKVGTSRTAWGEKECCFGFAILGNKAENYTVTWTKIVKPECIL